ncbi:MAG: biotin synthase BioB [Vampirovibrionales bacterium]
MTTPTLTAPPVQAIPAEGYSLEHIEAVYQQPFMELVFQAASVHRQHWANNEVQLATLANIKSGKCPEDCKYCPQSSKYHTGVESYDLPPLEDIAQQAQQAKANGSSRFCMGAAWRTPPSETHFNHVLDMVKTVKETGLEACVTLGMVNAQQAQRLKEAGLTAYNHNLDTSPKYYPEIISTRTYEDRLNTLKAVGDAGLQVCSGGILGMGETQTHRLELLQALSQLEHPPESIPINCLVPVEGTPLEAQPPVDPIELVRMVATARILFPKAKVRLSAGRLTLSDEAQALCFLAGANSMFAGERLLTTPNPGVCRDTQLFEKLNLSAV